MFVSMKIDVYMLLLYVNIYCIKLCKIICLQSGLPRLALHYLQASLVITIWCEQIKLETWTWNES